MTETVELKRETLKKLLEIIDDNVKLLEDIPPMQDEDRLSEASQIIGAELEAIITMITKIEKENPEIQSILNNLDSATPADQEKTLEDLEDEILGQW